MISFFRSPSDTIFAVQSSSQLSAIVIEKLEWLFGQSQYLEQSSISGPFIGPRATMITPWSTNAVEICENMGVDGINRIERFKNKGDKDHDPMLEMVFPKLDQEIFSISIQPASIQDITDIAAYNLQEGLALNKEEVTYLEELSHRLGRPLTDSEVFGFSQVNSEHCRHKIFNGQFVIDGEKKETSLFKLIKKTSQKNHNTIVSAYKDNVAFIEGPRITQFSPEDPDRPSKYSRKEVDAILSIKAETHNFPTTVEPFNGAATGSGGEIRDRLAGGIGSIPLSGTAVYMTSYPRIDDEYWYGNDSARPWLYQTPLDILIKASNGASDFGNKFGQPLISGSLLTFEHHNNESIIGFDKVIMLAGGIGYGKKEYAQKNKPQKGDKIVLLGGDNYRIGMGGAAVSSADTGEYGSGIELNAVQRSNPEMQKRVANTIRALVETSNNPIISIHDHGAGGHLNCLSELVEETGGTIDINKLPVGDPTLSAKELIGNESQERMGLIVSETDLPLLKRIAERERSPIYVVGTVTGNHHFSFVDDKDGVKPIDLALNDMFGSSPKTVMIDHTLPNSYPNLSYDPSLWRTYLSKVLAMEAVACKDWLTNKVDRCVGGLVATQQCVGELQLPLNNVGVMSLDFTGSKGVANAIGHSPITGLIDAKAGSVNSIAESLTNIIWTPLENGLKSVSLSANWMWPCKNPGEDARLYQAVEAASDFAIALGINIPTGKDSLSMAQKYKDQTVLAPGTVIITAAGQSSDIRKTVEPVLQLSDAAIYHVDLSGMAPKLGGSSFAQAIESIGNEAPSVANPDAFAKAFNIIQHAISNKMIIAGHDVSAGGLITCLLEMCFPSTMVGMTVDLNALNERDLIKVLFSENAGLVFQGDDTVAESLALETGLTVTKLGYASNDGVLKFKFGEKENNVSIAGARNEWFKKSYLLDKHQTQNDLSEERLKNFARIPLKYTFPENFEGQLPKILDRAKPIAAIIREKGSNSEREMANALFHAGFEVRDVHMTDLIAGRETLEEVQFLGAVGGFSNSDVLGSAKGWAGSFKYNDKAAKALHQFFSRKDTLSIGICNGCQLFLELDLINPDHEKASRMTYNDSGKHECSFTSVTIAQNNSVMMKDLAGTTLGVWISHGEGKFSLPLPENRYKIIGKYGYNVYPSNPNGSDYNAAMIASDDGRHVATMPHIERSFFAWNWAFYPKERQDEVSPWAIAFKNAYEWIIKQNV